MATPGRLPNTLQEFCSMGTPCSIDSWKYSVWKQAWGGSSGITSLAVQVGQYEYPITPDMPTRCWVMKQSHPDEFGSFGISDVFVRKSYLDITRSMIQFYEEDLVNWTNEAEAEAEVEMNEAAMKEEGATKEEAKDNFLRKSYLDITRSMIQFYKDLVNWTNEAEAEVEMNDTAMKEEAMNEEVKDNFPNPFEGFQTKNRMITIVSGYSNSGKTVFLWFLLRCRLQAKLPTILQVDVDTFSLFSEFGVHQFKGSPWDLEDAPRLSRIQPDIWCLVDANAANPTPAPFLQWSHLSIVEACNIAPEWREKVNLEWMAYDMPQFTPGENTAVCSLQPWPAGKFLYLAVKGRT
ncbi:hypothetical protein AZE42_11012 [Rhizopogon vesiculosus]|uniref:Uncharacterized protein n=1 Tax=Rhizopogon vesiculosus TaxID=180088 RepID=A0A1J8Q496_9AGAM|nr:hypothetical protein AZE42_11012 [Rhizopogon vesiculosus]